ncbi:MAG: S24/S26 family peptidase [Pseudomonadota bacterium]
MLKLIKVKGDSMQPCYRHNDYLLISKPLFRSISVGDDVVCKHPGIGTIFKRINKIQDKKIELKGLNMLSSNPSEIGVIRSQDIIGRVIWHFAAK